MTPCRRRSYCVLLIALVVSVFPLGSRAENDGSARWTGLWCSGRDELGIATKDNHNTGAPSDRLALYAYVLVKLGDSDSYSVEGPISPSSGGFSLVDGECELKGELLGESISLTDNQHCDKISAAFNHTMFTRVTDRLPPYRKARHCGDAH